MGRLGTLIICVLAGIVLSVPVVPISASAQQQPQMETDLVRIERVEVLLSTVGPVVLLTVQNRAIPILVDYVVAESIQGALAGLKPRRPLSHDLMHTILAALEARVSQVVITLKGDTYYADLTLVARDTSTVFDSRSSDAIALAIHFKAPILVSRALVESAGRDVIQPHESRL